MTGSGLAMPQRARYTRRLSPFERYALAVHEAHDFQVIAVVEGEGALDAGRLRRAVEVAAAANPGVRVRLRGALGFTRWVDGGVPPEVRVIEGCGWDGRSERGAEFLREGLDPLRGGPVADVLVLPEPGPRTRLIFRGHHAAFDGRGLMHWMEDVFRVLRGEAPVGSRSSRTDHDVRVQHRDRVADPVPPAPAASIPILPAGPPTDDLSHTWRRVIVPRRSGSSLVRSAIFLAEWARRREPGTVTFRVPVDYRGLRTSEVSVGNLLGFVRLVVREGDTPRALTRQLAQRIGDYEDCREAPGLEAFVRRPIRRLARKLRGHMAAALHSPESVSGGLVSMGFVDLEAGYCPGFRTDLVYGIPPAVGRFNAIITDFADHTAVTLSVPSGCNASGELDELAEALRDFLTA